MVRTESEFADRIRFIQQNHSLNEEAESLLNRYGEDFRTWFFDEFVSSIDPDQPFLLRSDFDDFDRNLVNTARSQFIYSIHSNEQNNIN